jgi:hypothetical protein
VKGKFALATLSRCTQHETQSRVHAALGFVDCGQQIVAGIGDPRPIEERIAAALILAEIERLDRLPTPPETTP